MESKMGQAEISEKICIEQISRKRQRSANFIRLQERVVSSGNHFRLQFNFKYTA